MTDALGPRALGGEGARSLEGRARRTRNPRGRPAHHQTAVGGTESFCSYRKAGLPPAESPNTIDRCKDVISMREPDSPAAGAPDVAGPSASKLATAKLLGPQHLDDALRGGGEVALAPG